MNRNASNGPPDDPNDVPPEISASDGEEQIRMHNPTTGRDESEPIRANLVETIDGAQSIRIGSPFAVDPIDPLAGIPAKRIEVLLDVGPIRYTAMGAVAASIMVLAFAAAAAWWFPAGGALIAALGCVLSIFGLYSTYRFTSAGLLAVHLCLFVVSYGRSLG